ncbi:Translocation protein sec63 [Fulvia fulva]|uniref:Translocation protein sec63 n=1 Tax=Passalora fulva TaxID=5499 RepID=A0A9Q8L9G3_PASFU|nr:Translocation protein sec63 [Fulvia fulva]KAK4630905.1 Translocation protein sec63 [Fulvia fulva]KAK4632533.1 Translocation protein sec63 [Fulvia fulva]UJO13240.1 Translocation protein sec63 [Fulvia fulva]WPV11911.1 Translocation protein sec63 [Fulvia fulva]WPV26080.1 Translocation protein sec63 [Fulvia fulva]
MSNEYNYDADAQFYPFYVITVSAFVALPLTYSLLRTPSDTTSQAKAGHITSSFKPDDADIIAGQRSKQKRKELRLKRIITAASAWLLILYSIYLIAVTARSQPKIWNPYDILDIGMSASEKQINSRYRKLSITMHPDKRQPNPALNQTIETINDDWVEIVKAYKALTDEEVRSNFIQYGNPDGKQSTSFGIALPQFLVAAGSGKYVLAIYGLLLGIGLPWLVGKWWYGMQSKTREKILVTSAGNMFRDYRDNMDAGDVVAAVSSADEFKDILSGAREGNGLGRVESKLAGLIESGAVMLPKDKKKLDEMEDLARRKTLALLWAYLNRLDLDDNSLEAEKYELAPTALQMAEAFRSTVLSYGNTAPLMAEYQVEQSLVQAVTPNAAGRAPLLQLPHFTPEIVREVEGAVNTTREHMTIQSFMALPAEQRQALAQAAGLTNDRLKVAESVAKQLPLLRVEKAFFKVQGEKHITGSSLVQYVIKARFIPPGTPASSIPPIDEKDLLDVDPAEGDIKAQKIEPEQHFVPLAHAPYFPQDRAPRWHVFLADNRQGKVAVPPFTFSTFDKKPFDSEGKPTFNVVTLKMQFAAPPQAGEYKFQMHLVCDSYIGFNHKQDAVMMVEDASKVQQVDEEDEISEPEEDSIAGQMAALKGQPTADPDKPVRNRKLKEKLAQEESDYESNTDEDEESESETDTDTDSEAEEAAKKAKAWW